MKLRIKITAKLVLALTIFFILFISLFALDSLGSVQALLIHLLPSFFLALVAYIAWKNSWRGGLLMIVTGIVMMWVAPAKILYIPTIILGFLFLLSERN